MTVSLAERKGLIKEYHSLALEIVSLSNIAEHSGLISEMNFHILSREFNNLVSIIDKDENKKANEQTVILDPSFFSTEEPKTQPTVKPTPTVSSVPDVSISPVISKGHVKDTVERERSVDRSNEPKDGKESRRGYILKLLSKKSGLNVKDFAEGIKGVSEKTIQRELLAMVAQGIIKKEGERRWSTYSL